MIHASEFRMTAFFFISGVLFSTRRFPEFKGYAIHKTKALLIPYIILSVIFLLLDPVVWNFDWFPKAPKMSVMNIRPTIESLGDYIYWNLAKIFVAGKSSIGSGPIWFVFTLYSISLMFYGLHKVASFIPSVRSRVIIALSAALSLALGWTLYKSHIRLPLGIERDLTALAFFAIGFLCKDFIKFLQTKSDAILIPLAIAAFALYGYLEDANPYYSIMNNDLGKSFFTFIGTSVTGILGLISSFILFSRLPSDAASSKAAALIAKPASIIKGVLRNISRNALVILAVHWWCLLILRVIFKTQLDKSGIAYLVFPIIIAVTVAAIPLFRCKLNKLIGKEKISVRESLSIQ